MQLFILLLLDPRPLTCCYSLCHYNDGETYTEKIVSYICILVHGMICRRH